MDAMRGWKAGRTGSGTRWRRAPALQLGSPPGVGDVKPWTSPLQENVTVEAFVRPGRQKGEPNTFGRDYLIKNSAYYLRPEVRGMKFCLYAPFHIDRRLLLSPAQTVESLYILWRTTGDVKWRNRGWDIFQAIERHTKTDSGYSNIDMVHTSHPTPMDSMPRYAPRNQSHRQQLFLNVPSSYFLAETLKYLYLLFANEDLLPLDKWVFNTEAHPLPVFAWSAQEREAYGIV